ncbi:unnamed protein product [Soboliphyme baturini]|uniref:Palmitoyltransferase n=1 Tax=Soboliphyme baturini TaxID=241478 RepID=A0A183J055_9BILA|nr:unnamed protein product [Soboliphyme baturini]
MIFRWDPCGLLCVILTYLFVGYADYVFIFWLIPPFWSESLWASFHVMLFNTILFGLLFAHMRAMFSDPGIVPMPSVQLDFSELNSNDCPDSDSESDTQRKPFVKLQGEDWSVCGRCEAYRPPRAHHCRICRRCIRKMDHHCPWINNCVGEFNQKYFLQFLFYVGTRILFLVIVRGFRCSNIVYLCVFQA